MRINYNNKGDYTREVIYLNKNIRILIFLLLLSTRIPIGINANISYNPLDGGWIEVIDGVTILHVSGSNYEMGYQHGYLLNDMVNKNYDILFNSDPSGEIYDEMYEVWNNTVKHHVPHRYIEEMQGLADGSGRPFNDVAVFVMGHDAFGGRDSGCMEMAAWDSATADGKLHHFYSYDVDLNKHDPTSNKYLQENQIIMIRKPNNGFASLQGFYAGTFAGCGGINEQEIAISMEFSPSDRIELNVTFIWFRMINVLDNASTVEEAIDIMVSNRNGAMNYVISDGKIPKSFICEEIVNYSYVGTWNNDIESTKPFWQIENVVRRKNMYIHPTTSKTQRKIYDPRIYLFIGLITGEPWFNTWSFYKTLSQEIEKKWGTLNSSNILSIARSIYNGETNIYLKLLEILGLEGFSSFHQWVACPETGDILISFADGNNQAQYNIIHQFNLFNLLESEPP